MALNQMRFDLAHRIQHYTHDNEQARPAEKLGGDLRNMKGLTKQARQHRNQGEKHRAGES